MSKDHSIKIKLFKSIALLKSSEIITLNLMIQSFTMIKTIKRIQESWFPLFCQLTISKIKTDQRPEGDLLLKVEMAVDKVEE